MQQQCGGRRVSRKLAAIAVGVVGLLLLLAGLFFAVIGPMAIAERVADEYDDHETRKSVRQSVREALQGPAAIRFAVDMTAGSVLIGLSVFLYVSMVRETRESRSQHPSSSGRAS
jgi:hypothetical protein